MGKLLETVDSIIFDLDGTLWDSTNEVVTSWNLVMNKYDTIKKEITLDELKGYMGLPLDEIRKKMLPYMSEKESKSIMKECCEIEHKHLARYGARLYDKLEDILKELSKKYKLFIVSNCQDGYIETFLDYNNFHKYFDDFECPGKSNLLKAENIKLIIERNHLKNPIYVGDTQTDCDASKKAGIPFVFAKYGFGNVIEYEYFIDKFEDLLAL